VHTDKTVVMPRTHPDLGDPDAILMPYVTRCSRTDLTR
jgi:hypothetical protein